MSKVCATKQVVSQKTPAQVTTIMPARRSTVSALASIISSQAAKIAATAKPNLNGEPVSKKNLGVARYTQTRWLSIPMGIAKARGPNSAA